jgi:hypothetical protein
MDQDAFTDSQRSRDSVPRNPSRAAKKTTVSITDDTDKNFRIRAIREIRGLSVLWLSAWGRKAALVNRDSKRNACRASDTRSSADIPAKIGSR